MINGIDFSTLEIEKYWDFPKSYKGNKREFVKDCIFSEDYIGSLKKDGEFHRIIKENGEVLVQSRGISVVTGTYGDKTQHIPHIVEEIARKLPNGTVLLGEIYYPDLSRNNSDVGSIMRCLPPKAVQRQTEDKNKLHYYIFDILAYNGRSMLEDNFQLRTDCLKEKIEPLFADSKFISVAQYLEGQELWEELCAALERGEEGMVITNRFSFYNPGKRTAKKTIKVKKELSEPIDVFFTGRYKSGNRVYTGKEIEDWQYWYDIRNDKKYQGKYYDSYINGDMPLEPITKNWFYGWAASIEIGVWDREKEQIIPIGYISGVTDFIKQDIVENNSQYVNRPCRVTCMEITKDNALRHPKFVDFRDDIDWKDCSVDKIWG